MVVLHQPALYSGDQLIFPEKNSRMISTPRAPGCVMSVQYHLKSYHKVQVTHSDSHRGRRWRCQQDTVGPPQQGDVCCLRVTSDTAVVKRAACSQTDNTHTAPTASQVTPASFSRAAMCPVLLR